MMLATPASRTAVSNGKSCSSRISRGTHVGRGLVQATFGQAVPHDVLGGRDHAILEGVSLDAADVGTAQLGRQVRVLAIRLLDAPPARIARHVKDRRQGLTGSRREHPPADGRRRRLDELRVPGRGRTDRLLEARSIPSEEAMQGLLVEDRGNPQPGLLDQEALHLVGKGSDLARLQVRPSGQARDLADPHADQPLGLLVVERPDPDDLERPDGSELGDLLLDGHPVEQGGDPLVNGQGRVPIALF